MLNRSLLLMIAALPMFSQRLTTNDYAHAEKFMGYNTNPLVYGGAVRPTWLDDGRFWYRTQTADGAEFIIVDPSKNSRAAAFDHAKLASALSAEAGATYDARHLPFQEIELNGAALSFNIENKRWTCDMSSWKCTSEAARNGGGRGRGGRGGSNESVSPDKKRSVF